MLQSILITPNAIHCSPNSQPEHMGFKSLLYFTVVTLLGSEFILRDNIAFASSLVCSGAAEL
jgi:hypothetical protein